MRRLGMRRSNIPALLAAGVLALCLFPAGPPYTAQGASAEYLAQPAASRFFSETGHTVSGKFLQYWLAHGELPQQGYPISEEMLEKSQTDGETYTVQYFERAVFEHHAKKQPPNDVLLSLLGVFRYQQKYPSGAPAQTPNTSPDSVVFPETNKRLGGVFLNYWNTHGGLAQQGYPISDEFTEVSDVDHKPYTVQYFERAVFEHHADKQPPNDVLLSHLGTFRYQDLHAGESAPHTKPPTAIPTAKSTATITPTRTRTPTRTLVPTVRPPTPSPTITPPTEPPDRLPPFLR